MFERYTEKARRTIFFARYEASQFGSPYIETEHLLLGLLREDKALANRFLHSHSTVESIRSQVEGQTAPREKVSTSVDLPLSHASKRVLAYGAEEAQRLNHTHIGSEHLLLGLLREESFAAQLLRERGVTLESVREQVGQSGLPIAQSGSTCFARLDQWLGEREARGGIYTVKHRRAANRTAHFAIYAADPSTKEKQASEETTPAEELAQIQKRLESLVGEVERAIANHEFEKANFYSGEERKERENLRLLRERFHLEAPPPPVPLLCIEIIGDERFAEVQRVCDEYIAEGVPEVWLLDPESKRGYTVTKGEGLRELKGGVLRIADPPLEMDLRAIFDLNRL